MTMRTPCLVWRIRREASASTIMSYPLRDLSIQTSLIDWTRPWYASIRAAAEQIGDHTDGLTALNECSTALALTNHDNLPLSFVRQAALPEGVAYEAFISATGQVPTRNNLHDYFNALVWLSFPKIKRQLNALQATQIANAGIGKSRGPARDAATIFDENAALLIISDTTPGHALAAMLRNHHWHAAFIEQRDAFNQHANVWLFGHALMEKLVTPYKAITAHTWVVTAPIEFFSMTHHAQREWLDSHIAVELATQSMSTASFTPLPVLGIPGWWQPQDQDFYDDATVFRPKQLRKK